ncbi:DEAD/DEAH box helicase [Pseudoalteromonas fenneropenaei]|uniref:DEAD/DEAH box helicase n=1 Tax=Pseudoalteromonas fenneropenaei TaxID=1737459 RepID=A0ABV7CI46_9GAMM
MTLPIDSIQVPFLAALRTQHVVVSAATGSGKSTRLPLWARELGKVLVIEPRRIACTALAEYVAAQSGQPLGVEIGYAIRFEQHLSEQTQVVFVTPGVALRWYFENQLHDFNVIMLDEFHERRWDMDLLLAVLKQAKQHRLILTSATLQGERLAHYLDAQLLHSDGKMYPVEERFQAADLRAMPDKQRLTERVKAACAQALADTQGDVLVFLPGKAEIQQCASALQSLACQVIKLYSGCSKTEQHAALHANQQRRVILATNVAETSLTIPNISCVIDSGLERRTHLRLGKTVLGLDAIARDSAQQRLGRAGRTQHGLCIRLYGQYAPLIATTPPEIQRESLTEFMLAAACLDADINTLSLLDNLPERAAALALDTLQQIGAIDAQYRATPHGKSLYPLPIDIELAHLVATMPNNTLRQAMIDAVAVIAVPASVYQLPNDVATLELLNQHLPNACDLELVIALVRGQLPMLETDSEALSEARQFSAMLRDAFQLPELAKAARYDRVALVQAIATARPSWLYVKRQNRRGAFGNGQSEVMPSKQSRLTASSEAMLVLDTFALAGNGAKQATTLATLCAPISLKQLAQLNIGDTFAIEYELLDEQLIQHCEQRYADVVLKRFSRIAPPEDLVSGIASLIASGQLLPEVAPAVQASLADHVLYYQASSCQAPGSKTPPPIPTLHEFLCTRLTMLGIESVADLDLINAEDLAFSEVEPWLLKAFCDKHPRTLSLPEQNLIVHYQFAAKRIVVEYQAGLRKDAPKRWELPAWQGFSISFQKASKVVAIR